MRRRRGRCLPWYGCRASFVGEGDIERFQSMGFWEDIDVVDFGLYLYGPIRARANLIAVET